MDANTVNQNAIIRVYPALPGRSGNNSILSYNAIVELIGEDLFEKNFSKFWSRGLDKFEFRLRRGLRVQIVAK